MCGWIRRHASPSPSRAIILRNHAVVTGPARSRRAPARNSSVSVAAGHRPRGKRGPRPGTLFHPGLRFASSGLRSRRRCAMAATPPPVELGTPAPDFRLPAKDGRIYEFADVAGPKGTVIVFICNHCPYVKAVIDRMVADARTLLGEGFGFAAICSNDAKSYPEDSFASMQRLAPICRRHRPELG